MNFIRQQDMMASIKSEAELDPFAAARSSRRFLLGASIRIGVLFLCLCLLIAASL